MSLHLLDMRPLKGLDPTEKANIPVSIAVEPDGTRLVVSRYRDPIWDWYPYIPQGNYPPSAKLIGWHIRLPDGRLLTDPEHAPLLESAKDFIWSLFAQPMDGHIRPRMVTLIGHFSGLTYLLRWMVQAGLYRFAHLAGRTLDFVQAAQRKVDGGKAAASTVFHRLLLVEYLYRQREKLNDALTAHPWPNETSNSLAGIKQGKGYLKAKTEFIPDAINARLIEVALDYVQKRSVNILAALQAINEAAAEKAAAGLGKSPQSGARTGAARTAGFKGVTQLTQESTRLRTACYIIIDQFSGIRDSEMKSLAVGCIAHGKSRDGSTDILWLHGTIYKTGIRPHKWLVPPVVEEAVGVLTRLTAHLREELRQEKARLERSIPLAIAKEKLRLVKRLKIIDDQMDKLFLARTPAKRNEIAVMSTVLIFMTLREFCAHNSILGEDGQPYPLHPHQFRRTYARNIARSELGDLLTLRDHFGHWSIDMTVYYADGGADEYEADTELLEMVAKEKMERQTEIMGSYLDSNKPLGNGNHWLKSWRSSVRTAANKENLIAEYAGSLVLTGTGHSWCVGSERGTCCGGLCVFEPQMCVECNHGLIGSEHRPVWEGIREQQIEALALDDMGPGGRARALTIIAEAEKVLRRLDGLEAT